MDCTEFRFRIAWISCFLFGNHDCHVCFFSRMCFFFSNCMLYVAPALHISFIYVHGFHICFSFFVITESPRKYRSACFCSDTRSSNHYLQIYSATAEQKETIIRETVRASLSRNCGSNTSIRDCESKCANRQGIHTTSLLHQRADISRDNRATLEAHERADEGRTTLGRTRAGQWMWKGYRANPLCCPCRRC